MIPRIRASAVKESHSYATYICTRCRYSTLVEPNTINSDESSGIISRPANIRHIATSDRRGDSSNGTSERYAAQSGLDAVGLALKKQEARAPVKDGVLRRVVSRTSNRFQEESETTSGVILRRKIRAEYRKLLADLKLDPPKFEESRADDDKWVLQTVFQGKKFRWTVRTRQQGRLSMKLALIDHLKGLSSHTIASSTRPHYDQHLPKVATRLSRHKIISSNEVRKTASPSAEPAVGGRTPRGRIYKPKGPHTSQNVKTIEPTSLKQTELDIPHAEIPRLSYGLDRVLFNPGVYHLQDPRSRVYNFDPSLSQIIDPAKFNYAALDEYRSPSNDNTLSLVAKEYETEFFSSTSAITAVLQHLHFLLSNWRPYNFDMLSKGFERTNSNTSASNFSKMPTSIYLMPKERGYALDKAGSNSSTVLSFMGQCLEKLLTVPKEEFQSYHVDNDCEIPKPAPHGYHFTKFGNMLVRSQLDAYDDRLPGTGIFDIKTRAVLPLRMDSLEHSNKDFKNYEIKTQQGEFESFEREFYDMARATMMKYSLQARLGRMDGIFVAYHNITRMFGFQYLSIADMDEILHGQRDQTLGDSEMFASLHILTDALEHATKKFPGEPLRLYFETKERNQSFTYVFVVPVTKEEIAQRHAEGQKQAQEYLEKMVQAANEEGTVIEGEVPASVSDNIARGTLDLHEQISRIRERIENSFEENNEQHLQDLAKLQDRIDGLSKQDYSKVYGEDAKTLEDILKNVEKEREPPARLAAFSIVAESKVNDKAVLEPAKITRDDKWEVAYAIEELEDEDMVKSQYLSMIRRHDESAMANWTQKKLNDYYQGYFYRTMHRLSSEGKNYRERMNRKDEERGVVIFEPKGR